MSDDASIASPTSRSIGALVRQQPLLVTIVAMALVGVGISIYLTTIHYAHVAPACTVNGIVNCSSVLKSRFSTVPGTSIPITIPGMIWFLVSGALAMAGLIRVWSGQDEPERLRLYQLLWAAGGMLFVLYLVYAEIVQLHNICEWCTGVHILTLATFTVAWYRFTEDSRMRAAPVYRSDAQHGQSVRNRSTSESVRSRGTHGYALPRSVRQKSSVKSKSAGSRSLRS
jgi:uncharacterized membrane protein